MGRSAIGGFIKGISSDGGSASSDGGVAGLVYGREFTARIDGSGKLRTIQKAGGQQFSGRQESNGASLTP
jgi:hypothetical protein